MHEFGFLIGSSIRKGMIMGNKELEIPSCTDSKILCYMAGILKIWFLRKCEGV